MKRYMLPVLLLALPLMGQPASVTVDPAARHQTILGWGATAARMDLPSELREAVLHEAVNELGLTGLRFEIPRREWEDAVNDDDDPYHVNAAAFRTTLTDKQAREWVLPFRQRVLLRREKFNLYVSPSFFDGGSSGTAPAWLLGSPAEYTEYATAFVDYLRRTHGLVPDLYSICNEAGNNNAFSPQAMAAIAKELGPALARMGVPTRLQYPECVNSGTSWRYLQAIADDADVWPWIGLLSYHLYGDRGGRTQIRDLGLTRKIPTAQTEFMGTTVNDLYDDLTDGGCSYWEHYVLCGRQTGGGVPSGCYMAADPHQTGFARYGAWWHFRGVMHYVRPGAVRIGSSSSEPSLAALAFDQAGRTTTVLLNTRPGNTDRMVEVKGLPAGTYGVASASGNGFLELGLKTVANGAPLSVNMARGTVVTIYPYTGANLPPSVVDAKAQPNVLALPRAGTDLSAVATDTEGDALSYTWTVARRPAAAAVVLATPTAARCPVSGLTAAGDYSFVVTVSDRTGSRSRVVAVKVVDGNQPPTEGDLHHRLPVTVALPQTSTELRGWALDPEGAATTYAWSIVSQPAGAAAVLATPDKHQCKLTGLTVAGVYQCRLAISDGTHTVNHDLPVTVYPDFQPPHIDTIAAQPAALAAPAQATKLLATVSDAQGSAVTCWWSLRGGPAGAKVVLATPGRRQTDVTGLTVPGTYLFTLTAINQTKTTTGQVTVVVGGPAATAPATTGGPAAAAAAAAAPGAPRAGTPTNAAEPAAGATDPPQPTTRDDRIITARGHTLGRVTAVGPAWIEITSDSGAMARYIPDWHGGMPADGGGPDKAVTAQIRAVTVGQRVRADWHVNDHIRLERVTPLP